MWKEAIYHRSNNNFAYLYDKKTVHIGKPLAGTVFCMRSFKNKMAVQFQII
ncbi:alpha amylase N-terminal ig-like domain-containing protein [Domibacillus mangrovi]|uniref:alpha amylase N-terminal ig-like domain-containing protein n=1 Tax=Domibacillus mangrovi TaxID=1714354 RepID=UPI0009FAB93B